MCVKDLIWDLNERLSKEISLSTASILQLAVVIGADSQHVRVTYQSRVDLAMRAAQMLADSIVEIWGVPVVNSGFEMPPGNVRTGSGRTLIEMLEKDSFDEQKAAAEYLRLASAAGTAGLNGIKARLMTLARRKNVLAIQIKRIGVNQPATAQPVLRLIDKKAAGLRSSGLEL